MGLYSECDKENFLFRTVGDGVRLSTLAATPYYLPNVVVLVVLCSVVCRALKCVVFLHNYTFVYLCNCVIHCLCVNAFV